MKNIYTKEFVVSEGNHGYGLGDGEVFRGTLDECIDYMSTTPIDLNDEDEWQIIQGGQPPCYHIEPAE